MMDRHRHRHRCGWIQRWIALAVFQLALQCPIASPFVLKPIFSTTKPNDGFPTTGSRIFGWTREQDDERTIHPSAERHDDNILISRRRVFRDSMMTSASLTVPTLLFPGAAACANRLSTTATAATDPDRLVDLHCLADLPPIPSLEEDNHQYVRIFFCRHGQTENNRLRMVQGARVDPPINDNGTAQAINLGRALALVGSTNRQQQQQQPMALYSSPLLRARMTAEAISQQQLGAASQEETKFGRTAVQPPPPPQQLSFLREVDFGPFAEGQPVRDVQVSMTKAYLAWSVGDLDYRPQGGGDNGREVLLRAATALSELAQAASKNNVHSVVAVTHSAYLRVLLGLVLDEPLAKAASRKIYNGSVTVIDVSTTHIMQPRNGLILPKDFHLQVPATIVQRVNEFRHLPPSTL